MSFRPAALAGGIRRHLGFAGNQVFLVQSKNGVSR